MCKKEPEEPAGPDQLQNQKLHPHKWTQHQDHQDGFCWHSSTNYLVPAQISRRDTPCIQVQQPPHHQTLARSLQDHVAPESTRNSSFIRDHSVYVILWLRFCCQCWEPYHWLNYLVNARTWDNLRESTNLFSLRFIFHPLPMQKSNLTRFLTTRLPYLLYRIIVLEIFYSKNCPII